MKTMLRQFAKVVYGWGFHRDGIIAVAGGGGM